MAGPHILNFKHGHEGYMPTYQLTANMSDCLFICSRLYNSITVYKHKEKYFAILMTVTGHSEIIAITMDIDNDRNCTTYQWQ